MADFVVGMAKSVVDGALTKAQAAIEEEGRLRHSAARNLLFITGEFDMMKSFLEVADSERLENPVVRTWVRQISDLAYDVEDCIEFVVHLDKKNRWWLRMLKPMASCLALAPIPLDVAIDDLDRLKAMVEDVSSRNARYSLISDSGSKPASAQNDEQQLPSSTIDGAVAGAPFQSTPSNTTSQKGRQCDLTQLLTKKDADLGVISIWGSGTGTGGGGVLGIASIAWNAYIDKETCKNFKCRAWVKLMHPFNLHEFVRSLTGQFHANSCCQEDPLTPMSVQVLRKMGRRTRGGDPIQDFRKLVIENRYLVVLESTMADWDAVSRFFPNMKNGSRIIFSTQYFEVASLAVGHPYQVLHLGELLADHSRYALFRKGSEYDEGNNIVANNAPASTKTEASLKWRKMNPLVGRESEMKVLGQTVTSAQARGYQVVSVWGIAGVGKSVLVKNSFCERISTSKIFKKYGWVDVSHPFNIWDFSGVLLSNLTSECLEGRDPAGLLTMGSTDTIVECRGILENDACLVVIDGLQSKEDWDLIKHNLVSGSHTHTVIIVVTTELDIATHCRGDKERGLVFNVKGLDADTAFELFNKVTQKGEPKDRQELTSRCGGLPRVIVEIAESLEKNKIALKHALSTNSIFLRGVETNSESDRLRGLFGWVNSYLRKCFCNFPDSLKPCILYLPIFPRNNFIRRRRLIRRWIAEGYSRDSQEVSAEMTGEQLFSNLLNLSIIQQPSAFGVVDTRIASCQVNGFFREYIVSRQQEENLVFELSGSCDLTTKRTGRHLVISENWVREKIVFESIDFSRLRSLTVFGNWESFFISDTMKLLRVLDLEGASKVECSDVERMLKLTSRLKFLSLRGCSQICHLPSSVGNMRQLQTLDVRNTKIASLPVNITKLEKLQYIRAGTRPPTNIAPSPRNNLVSQLSSYVDCTGCRHRVGVVVPGRIKKLTLLHTLGVVNVSTSGTKAVLEDLKKLTHLHKLGVSGINKNNSKRFLRAIEVLVHLESLSVRLENNNGRCLDGISLPLESLRSLKLHGLGDRLPDWNGQLTMLAKLDLEIAKLTEEEYEYPSLRGVRATTEGVMESTKGVIKILSDLGRLCILRLGVRHLQDDVLNVSVITNNLEEDSFKNMKIFEIGCSSISLVTFGAKTMKRLEQLKVDCGSGSRLFGLEHLPELEEVFLNGPSRSDQALIGDLKEKLENHPKARKPVVKPQDLPSSS